MDILLSHVVKTPKLKTVYSYEKRKGRPYSQNLAASLSLSFDIVFFVWKYLGIFCITSCYLAAT